MNALPAITAQFLASSISRSVTSSVATVQQAMAASGANLNKEIGAAINQSSARPAGSPVQIANVLQQRAETLALDYQTAAGNITSPGVYISGITDDPSHQR